MGKRNYKPCGYSGCYQVQDHDHNIGKELGLCTMHADKAAVTLKRQLNRIHKSMDNRLDHHTSLKYVWNR